MPRNAKENAIFKDLQSQMDYYTDRLHEKLEMDLLAEFFSCSETEPEEALVKFRDFRQEVSNLTNVMQKFRTQLLDDIDSGGLLDEETLKSTERPSQPAPSKAPPRRKP